MYPDPGIVNAQAEALEHVEQRLLREESLLLVTGLVQTDHEAVTNQRITPDAGKVADVFNSRCSESRGNGHKKAQKAQNLLGHFEHFRG